MNVDLEGQSAIVTGSNDGLGLAFAQVLARCGATVWVNGRREEKVDRAVGLLRDEGLEARPAPGDVSLPGVIDDMVGRVVAESGRLDILVNNAAIAHHAVVWETSDEDWEDVLRVDLTGVFRGVRAAARVMRDQGHGRIVNLTSSAGLDGSPVQTGYSAAKAGVIGLTKAAARQLAPFGVTVNALAPAAATEMARTVLEDPEVGPQFLATIPMGRFASPEEVAPSILALVGPSGSFTTGHVLLVDGGKSM